LVFFKIEFACKIYAYCLMINHVHLLVEPGDNPESLSLLMKHVAGRQTRYINKLEKQAAVCGKGGLNPVLSQQKSICRLVVAILSSILYGLAWSIICPSTNGQVVRVRLMG